MERKVYCFWTGDNPLTPNRARNLKSSIKVLKDQGVELVLVTTKNLDDYVKRVGVPLHPGYKCLSFTHRADYLRCYFMHFIGGGYSDIKAMSGNWKRAFKDLDAAPDKYCNGYQEVSAKGVSPCYGNQALHDLLAANYRRLIGNGCYIFRKQTPFTTDWYNELMKFMDKKYERLVQYPGRHPREGRKEGYDPTYKYPVEWFEMLGDIFHPICYKYRHHILQTCPKFIDGPYK